MFTKYISNTLASNGSQTVFYTANDEIMTGYVFLKVFRGGCYDYIFTYTNTIDSTFADGSISKCNDVCKSWKIHSLSVAITKEVTTENAHFTPVTINGSTTALIDKALIFTDPVKLNAEKNDYICIKLVFSGEEIPYHEESKIPIFIETDKGIIPTKKVPLPVFTGIDASAEKRVAFIGDSITQGCGTPEYDYQYYAAFVAEMLGEKYSFWDMGIGYARGADAATDGAWLYRAKQNDIVSVCFGVNDIFQGFTTEQIKENIKKITVSLKEAGCTVILQTVPPFDYDEEHEKMWREVNCFIRTEMTNIADEVFDDVPILSHSGKADDPKSKYGAHPDEHGHLAWAEKLAPIIKKYLT